MSLPTDQTCKATPRRGIPFVVDSFGVQPKLGVKAQPHVRGPQASKPEGGHPIVVVRTLLTVVLIAQWLFNVTMA